MDQGIDPEKWFAQYDEKLRDAAAQAEKAEKALKTVGGSATSQDGEVTVRVNASGATTDLVLRAGVRDFDHEHLARVILQTTRQAQRDVGQQVVDVMTKFVGEGAALEAVKEHLPEGFAGDGTDEVFNLEAHRDKRPDDEYFDNPPEVIK
ncbi:YbaB/EbfC family nucleoid-associated protein [Actinophytocola gossypii]|uniref:YbaB/EbfC family nucleoid-associated protein n=1 Tax=Actinophytocola gossypii TaxID=2812003 RepID=UPI0021A45CA6|nr:YbaB/EbfC family nucleoid-associated protein [Actinophytocola gossypii]